MKLFVPDRPPTSEWTPGEIGISVYGLGKMGLPFAAVFAAKGFRVIGVDTNATVVDRIAHGVNPIVGEPDLDELVRDTVAQGTLTATTDGDSASRKTDVKIIIVPTYLDQRNNPDLAAVIDVTARIGRGLQAGDLVILESTAPPGTTIECVARQLEEASGLRLNIDFAVAHCPERTNSGTAIADILGRINPKIIGASHSIAAQALRSLYERVNARGVVIVSSTTVAEMVKVSEGVFRDVNIAFGNTLYLMCRELGIDAHEVIAAANTDAACNILTPGPGVGGHCIPVYPYFFLTRAQAGRPFLSLARAINDGMSAHVIDLLDRALQEHGVPLASANVLVLGVAYRGGVKETRKSPGLKIVHELQGRAANVFGFDPLFSIEEMERLEVRSQTDFAGLDGVILTADHESFRALDWGGIRREMRTPVVVDARNIVDRARLGALGFTVRSVGYAK